MNSNDEQPTPQVNPNELSPSPSTQGSGDDDETWRDLGEELYRMSKGDDLGPLGEPNYHES